jgi:hypothetical protein
MPNRLWTHSEIDKLKSLAGTIPTAQIASEIGRPTSGVIMKAFELKLSLKLKPNQARSPANDPGPAGIDLTI